MVGDSETDADGNAKGGGNDRIFGEDGDEEHITGDSVALGGDAEGGGRDRLEGGNGDDDIIDLGTDGGLFAIGDHNIGDPQGGQATGAGNDRITGGTADDTLIGESSVGDATQTFAGHDVIDGRGGNDHLFGDNVNFDGDASVGTAGGRDQLHGGTGDDAILAGPANDLLDGGANTDSCDGEAGNHDIALRCESVTDVP
ncbi:calcium-binding protein [Streptomyces tanashiensis]|uniref:calcium-binding protein n=1 Tax=Streptomyces tanashiensis TaxID=67367 RepID=UPI0033F6DA08